MSEPQLIKCSCCDKMLPATQIELTFKKPDEIADLSTEELESRCEQLWEDGFNLENERFFIRALIPLQIHESDDEYCLGAWVELNHQDYQMILDDWENDIASPSKSVQGRLANNIPYTHNSLGAKVSVVATD